MQQFDRAFFVLLRRQCWPPRNTLDVPRGVFHSSVAAPSLLSLKGMPQRTVLSSPTLPTQKRTVKRTARFTTLLPASCAFLLWDWEEVGSGLCTGAEGNYLAASLL